MTAPGYVPPPPPGWWVKKNTSLSPAPAVLTLTGGVPTIVAPRVLTPAAATLTLTGGTPALTGSSFVVRDPATGNLMLNGQRFRFAGGNCGNDIGTVGTANGNAYGGVDQSGTYITTHAQVDAFLNSAQAMNHNLVKATWSVQTTNYVNSVEPTLGVYNAAALDPIDWAVKQSASRGIRLVVPFCEEYFSKPWYVAQTGGGGSDNFYTRTATIDAYKAHISFVLDHINPYTGIALKNDPTIAWWANGNELTSALSWTDYTTWADDIAQYIKVTKGAQQLVMDGRYGFYDGVSVPAVYLQAPHIDIYENHTYDEFRTPAWLTIEANAAHSYGKAFHVGEFSWTDKKTDQFTFLPWNLVELLSTIETQPNFDGDTFWDLLAPLTLWNDSFTMHRPGDTTDMQTRGTQLTDHATVMSSRAAFGITVIDSASTSVFSNNVSLTFNPNKWTPRANDLVVYWVTFSQSGGIAIPGGWFNPLGGNTVVDIGTHTCYAVCHRVTAAEESAATFTYTASAIQGTIQTTICGLVLRGVDPNNPIDSVATTSNGAVTPHVLAGLSGANLSDKSLVLSGIAKDGVGGYFTPDGWGRATWGVTNQTCYVFQRNVRAKASSNVAATNVVPDPGADEYISITIAFAERVEPIAPVPALIPNRNVGPMALRNAFRRPQPCNSGPDHFDAAVGASTAIAVGLTADGVVGVFGSANTAITVGLTADGVNPDNVVPMKPAVTVPNRNVGPMALRNLFRRAQQWLDVNADTFDGGDPTGTGSDTFDGGDPTGAGSDTFDGGWP